MLYLSYSFISQSINLQVASAFRLVLYNALLKVLLNENFCFADKSVKYFALGPQIRKC